MRFLISFIAALALTGCQSFYEQPITLKDRPFEVTRVVVTVEENPKKIADYEHSIGLEKVTVLDRVKGLASWSDLGGTRHCHIILRHYPYGLGHEMDHCLRGKWHGDASNGDDFE